MMSSEKSLLIENSLKYYNDEYVIGKSLLQKDNILDDSSLEKNHQTILNFMKESTGESTKELTMNSYYLCETV
tara:strand:+ start:288 stop:506 length:219 start_codon:yes stop_codon:yes gene_type:complete